MDEMRMVTSGYTPARDGSPLKPVAQNMSLQMDSRRRYRYKTFHPDRIIIPIGLTGADKGICV